MTNKSKIILLILSMVFTVVLALYASFAWYKMIETTEPILINTGSLKVNSTFYYGVDTNFDGIVDDDTYIEVDEGGLIYTNVVPGQKYPYRIYVQNLGTIPGYLSISINDIIACEKARQGLKICFVHPLNGYQEITFDSVEPNENNILVIPLFQNFELEDRNSDNSSYVFDFIIEITADIDASIKNEQIKIKYFLIKLDQIPN